MRLVNTDVGHEPPASFRVPLNLEAHVGNPVHIDPADEVAKTLPDGRVGVHVRDEDITVVTVICDTEPSPADSRNGQLARAREVTEEPGW
ncbi:hypothetical protein [Frigoribacterium sp. PhB118]|uniref:hypothetical protein n=1 Tax=Frigoribacterium sp. PhB118 TaxID=2485175 RepID=UPI001F16D29D|nr:hypothetical protein [Frigoribacterium sp. PhB118]